MFWENKRLKLRTWTKTKKETFTGKKCIIIEKEIVVLYEKP